MPLLSICFGSVSYTHLALADRMRQLQQELIDRTESGMNYDDLAEEILRLRELQEQAAMDDTARAAHQERIQELLHFIHSQSRTITEFDAVSYTHLDVYKRQFLDYHQ